MTSSLPYTPHAFHNGRWHGVGHPDVVAFFREGAGIERLPVQPDTTTYMQRPNLVREVQLPVAGALPWSRVVVKRFGWRGRQHYLLSPLKRSKAVKAYRTACHLLTYHLGTPLPLGAFEERCWGFIQYNAYITEAITGYMTVRDYCRTLPDGLHGVAEVLQLTADYTRRMHDSGLWHRDLFLSNFLLAGPPGDRQLYLVDLNRSFRLPYMPLALRALDIARMEWREWQPQFIALYCAERFPVTPVRCLARLYSRWRTWRWRLLQRIKPLRQRIRRRWEEANRRSP
jgi:hypothetical protein